MKSRHVSVRKISNGYLRTESHETEGGGYEHKETFHRQEPSLDPRDRSSAGRSMAEALKELKR